MSTADENSNDSLEAATGTPNSSVPSSPVPHSRTSPTQIDSKLLHEITNEISQLKLHINNKLIELDKKVNSIVTKDLASIDEIVLIEIHPPQILDSKYEQIVALEKKTIKITTTDRVAKVLFKLTSENHFWELDPVINKPLPRRAPVIRYSHNKIIDHSFDVLDAEANNFEFLIRFIPNIDESKQKKDKVDVIVEVTDSHGATKRERYHFEVLSSSTKQKQKAKANNTTEKSK